jgi:hypothetical protein
MTSPLGTASPAPAAVCLDATSALTAISTGTNPSEWRVWWAIESRRTGTDWEWLLDEHYQVFQQLRQHVGLSS